MTAPWDIKIESLADETPIHRERNIHTTPSGVQSKLIHLHQPWGDRSSPWNSTQVKKLISLWLVDQFTMLSEWQTILRWISEQYVNGRGYGRILSWSKSKYHLEGCLEGLIKNNKHFGKDARCSSHDSNRASPEYESRALPLCQPA
jgi:hypothetical protein